MITQAQIDAGNVQGKQHQTNRGLENWPCVLYCGPNCARKLAWSSTVPVRAPKRNAIDESDSLARYDLDTKLSEKLHRHNQPTEIWRNTSVRKLAAMCNGVPCNSCIGKPWSHTCRENEELRHLHQTQVHNRIFLSMRDYTTPFREHIIKTIVLLTRMICGWHFCYDEILTLNTLLSGNVVASNWKDIVCGSAPVWMQHLFEKCRSIMPRTTQMYQRFRSKCSGSMYIIHLT